MTQRSFDLFYYMKTLLRPEGVEEVSVAAIYFMHLRYPEAYFLLLLDERI